MELYASGAATGGSQIGGQNGGQGGGGGGLAGIGQGVPMGVHALFGFAAGGLPQQYAALAAGAGMNRVGIVTVRMRLVSLLGVFS